MGIGFNANQCSHYFSADAPLRFAFFTPFFSFIHIEGTN